jgi:hypothetical protein
MRKMQIPSDSCLWGVQPPEQFLSKKLAVNEQSLKGRKVCQNTRALILGVTHCCTLKPSPLRLASHDVSA